MTAQPDDDRTVRPFAAWLQEQGKGRTHAELSDGLHDLIAKVKDTGKKGTITLIVTVAPLEKGDGVFVVSDEIRLKLPEHDRPASMYFLDRAGNLSRRDPNQLELPVLKSLDDPDPAHVNTATGEIKEAT